MRNLYLLDRYRRIGQEVIGHWGWVGDDTCGMFTLPSPIDQAPMNVVASSGDGWDHVSVSRVNRCPNWIEMDHVKQLFFKTDETAMQLHVPRADHISFHNNCLHLWRPLDAEIPRPPASMVGPTTEEASGT